MCRLSLGQKLGLSRPEVILGLGLRVRLKREGRLGLREMGSKNETRPNRITKGRNKIIIIILMLIITLITLMLIINDKRQKLRTYIKQMVFGQKWVITAAPLCILLRIRDRAKTMSTHFVRNYRKHTHIFFFF